jgi:peroxiredoxin
MGEQYCNRNNFLRLLSKLALVTVLLGLSWLLGQYWAQATISLNLPALPVNWTVNSNSARQLANLQAEKPAIVYFFDLRCSHCAQVLPQVQPFLQQAHNAGLTVIGITPVSLNKVNQVNASNAGATLSKVQQTHSLPGYLLADFDRRLSSRYQIFDFTLLLVNRHGTVYLRQNVGYWNTAIATNTLQQLKHWDWLTTSNLLLLMAQPQISNELADCFIGTSLQGYSNYYLWVKIGLIGLSLALLCWAVLGKLEVADIFSQLASGGLILLLALSDVWLATWSIYLLIAALLLPYYRRGTGFVVLLLYGLILYQGFLITDSLSTNYLTSFVPQIWHPTTLLWQILPAMGMALAIANLSIIKVKYRYPVKPITSITTVAPNAGLAIKEVSRAERCDICHKTDEFNYPTGYCRRCQTYTG